MTRIDDKSRHDFYAPLAQEELVAASKDKSGGLKWGITFAGGADHNNIDNFASKAGYETSAHDHRCCATPHMERDP